jgi:AraC-like DNA-binding protein
MLFIPLPFIVAALLLVLLLRLILENGTNKNAGYFYALIGGYALLATVIGLRWGYNLKQLLPIMPILATSLPPLAWLAFQNLAAERPTAPAIWSSFMPALAVVILLFVFPSAIDIAVPLTGIFFAGLLLNMARLGPDALVRTSLSHAILAHRALTATATMLILSAIVDGIIAIDFAFYGGAHAANFVSYSNLLGILVLGAAAAVASGTQPHDNDEDAQSLPATTPSTEEVDLVSQIDAFVLTQKLYRDPDLTLNRLSRKLMIPARRISMAINRVRGESVSVFMNRHRITEACHLLQKSDQPITSIMFESGFQTKSNFNEAFRKITGTNPASWRDNNIHAEIEK